MSCVKPAPATAKEFRSITKRSLKARARTFRLGSRTPSSFRKIPMARHLHSRSVVLSLVLGLLSFWVSAAAQSNQQNPSAEKQQEASAPDQDTNGVTLPAPLGGMIPPLTSHGESAKERMNLLTGSLGVSAFYTDNAFNSGGQSTDDYQYQISPGIELQSFGQHTQWMLNYAGGITIDQSAPGNSQQNHIGVAELAHRFTRRLAAEFRQDFSRSNNPFAKAGENLSIIAGPGQLSNFAVPAPVTRTSSISSANATYQLSQHSSMGFSGNISVLKFQDDEALAGAGGTLVNTTNIAGRAFYLRQTSVHQTIGAEYQVQELRFK